MQNWNTEKIIFIQQSYPLGISLGLKEFIMKANWLPLSAAVALALGSVTASAVDFHGYFRAGMQANAQGGNVYCAGDGTAGHKVGRLADECDTYAEIVLGQEIYNKANSKFTVNTRISYGINSQSCGVMYNSASTD